MKFKADKLLIASIFLILSLGSNQMVASEDFTISNQNSCEDIGGTWDFNACDLSSFTVQKNDSLQITGGLIRIHETLDNFGKIVINDGSVINAGGNITNHYGGVIIVKSSGGIINNFGVFSNDGIINNVAIGGEERLLKTSSIINNLDAIFSNRKTGIIYNEGGATFFNLGILYNNNVIFNDGSQLSNSGHVQKGEISIILSSKDINFTGFKSLIFNNKDGIIFNNPGSYLFNNRNANITNADGGLIFNDVAGVIFNSGSFKNHNKILSECGGIIVDYQKIVEPAIEITC